MAPVVDRAERSPLESALLEVHATLAGLLAAADEQYAAVAASDPRRLERVTRQQEQLSARLARAEARRLELTRCAPVASAASTLPTTGEARASALSLAIARAAQQLKSRHARTASLLQQSIELSLQKLDFLHTLVTPSPVAYGARGASAHRPSALLDSHA